MRGGVADLSAKRRLLYDSELSMRVWEASNFWEKAKLGMYDKFGRRLISGKKQN